MMQFPVFLKEKIVGNACVTRQGLYYGIDCLCNFPKEGIYRIEMTCGKAVHRLGICVPRQNGFGLQTSMAVKRIGEGDFLFRALQGGEEAAEHYIPIVPNEAFLHLQQLKTARLEIRHGTVGIMLKSSAPDLQDSGQNPSHLRKLARQ